MRQATRERINREISDWCHDGLIDAATAERLGARYAAGATMGQVLLRWLGFFALFWLGSSLLGLLGLALGEAAAWAAPVVVGAFAVALWRYGIDLATAVENRYPITGAVLVTASFFAGFASLALLYGMAGGADWGDVILWLLALVAGGAIATAYSHGLRWPLAFGILAGFHAIGNAHGYAGRGAYVLALGDLPLTALLGTAVALLGHLHERREIGRWAGFGTLYLIFGLLYLNLALWVGSIRAGGVGWLVLFTLAGVAQLALGAVYRDGRLVGFGIVFLAIDIYTRFYEHFWNTLSKGSFFLLAGVAALVVGAILERQHRGDRS
ncbi:MAG: hypothetical protein AAGE01_21195 [Pseudomonadota bacterium]